MVLKDRSGKRAMSCGGASGRRFKQRAEELKPAYGGYRFNGCIYVNMASAV